MEFFGWTSDIVMDMQQMFRDGKSSTDVAAVYGISRNSVLGKMHRLGLTSGAGVQGIPRQPYQRAKPAPATIHFPIHQRSGTPVVSRGTPTTAERADVGRARIEGMRKTAFVCEPGQGVTLMDLRAHGCRWPLGEVGDEAFRYCGTERPALRPYCDTHHAIGHRPRGAV